MAEILGYAFEDDEVRRLRYLRLAQFRALETYWYLRLRFRKSLRVRGIEGAPGIVEMTWAPDGRPRSSTARAGHPDRT